MSKIAVVYWSGTGNTEAMANLVAEGATSAGAETEVIPCADFSADKAAEYDDFAFGCPAMGSEELEYDEFQPMWDEVKEILGDKKVVLFGSYSWAEGEWMDSWKADADGSGSGAGINHPLTRQMQRKRAPGRLNPEPVHL